MSQAVYTATKACEYLGIHKQSLEKYQRSGKLMFDYQFANGERAYKHSTLEAYKTRWQSKMMTQEEVGIMFGVSPETVKYHFRRKRNLTPDADRGQFGTYSDNKVLMVARSEYWVTHFEQEVVGKQIICLMKIEATKQWALIRRTNNRMRLVLEFDTYEPAYEAMVNLASKLRQEIQQSQSDRR